MSDGSGESPEVIQIGHSNLIELSWAELILDPQNPRLEEASDTTREEINALLDLERDKLLNLAKDISETGRLSPFEIPGVVVEDGLYIVVEGNRRVAALRMLKSPDLVDDPRIRRRVEAIAAGGTGPEKVACNLFDSREESRHWIELRHRGEMDGRGVSPWTTDMANRFSRAPGSQTDLAMQLRDLMLAAFPDDDELKRQLTVIFRGGNNSSSRRIRSRPTTLGRLLAPIPMQEAFGYAIEGGVIRIVGPEAEVHRAFRRMIFDVSEGLRAQDIYNRPDIEDYIADRDQLKVTPPLPPPAPAPGPTPAPGGQNVPASPSGGAPGGSTTPGAGTIGPSPAAPPSRRRMPRLEQRIFEGLRLRKFDIRTSNTLKEAQLLNIDNFPLITGIMVRVIVELCVTEAIGKLGISVPGRDTLRAKLKVVLEHLDPQIAHSRNRGPRLAAAWMDSQKDNASNGLGVDLMNAYVHSFTQAAGPTDVRALSSTYRPLLEDLDNQIP
jgi:hypothetical protein